MSQVDANELIARIRKARAWADHQAEECRRAVATGAPDSENRAAQSVAYSAVSAVLGKILDPDPY
ncbi:hypothetical protein [Kitasatospora sp. NPDC051914]|uniref:hypothetical protein n=1 Tax=Kitasatospora sp. NPDC051914 TaxID=3154945 RepID=UPI003422649D